MTRRPIRWEGALWRFGWPTAALMLVGSLVLEIAFPTSASAGLAGAAILVAGVVCLADAATALLIVGLLVTWSGWLFLAQQNVNLPAILHLTSPWAATPLLGLSLVIRRVAFTQQ